MTQVSDRTGHVTNEVGNHYLTRSWRPADAELDEASLTVVGELPERLRGRFVRNGPNPMFEPIAEYHMFDGDGMLHERSHSTAARRPIATVGSSPRDSLSN